MGTNDHQVPGKRKRPLDGDKSFISYGWLSVYYREAATAAGFHTKDTAERWQLLRDRVVLAIPKDDGIRQRAIDAIPEEKRSQVLNWLQLRDSAAREDALPRRALPG